MFGGAHHPVPINEANVLGILSLVFWALMIVVSIKYIVFIMRANNKGEGGIMALMALVLRGETNPARARVLMLMGLFGAALFYGDGLITPAISVLSAVEGLEVATPAFKPYVIPITLIVLVVLFAVQKRGTGSVGALFGPVMIVWFATLATLGLIGIARTPQVLAALNPLHAVGFLATHGAPGFFSLGAVVLVVTGAEALYADMGHFGSRPVRLAWSGLVLPALALNYFGQGALLLADPTSVENPFYLLAPTWALYPLVALATVATIIASQAVISGAFSITQQAMQLGYAPRMEVQHTSSHEIGQIYLPGINRTLFLGGGRAGAGLRLLDQSRGGLRHRGHRHHGDHDGAGLRRRASDVALESARLRRALRRVPGRRRRVLQRQRREDRRRRLVSAGVRPWRLRADVDLEARPRAAPPAHRRRLDSAAGFRAKRVVGMHDGPRYRRLHDRNPDVVPHALLHSLKHYKSLHERVVLLTAVTLDVPHVPPAQHVAVESINAQFHKVKVFFGFMDDPDLPDVLEWCAEQGLRLDMMDTSFFLGRETLVPTVGADMALWREKLFVAMYRNAGSVANYFNLPPNRVVELGSQVAL